MTSSNEDLVKRHVKAFNDKDVDALLADFTDDATWVTGDYIVPPGGLREFFTGAFDALVPHLTLRRVIDGGDAVAAEMTEQWTHDGTTRTAALIAVFELAPGVFISDPGTIRSAKIYREGTADA